MALFKRSIETASKPGATFFDAKADEGTNASTKPAKTRKTRGKTNTEKAVDTAPIEREPLQQTIDHPRETMLRMLERAESQRGQVDTQPTSATRTTAFRRPGPYNSLGLRSNGPMTFSTHPNEYDELHARSIAAERAEVKVKQERRAIAGLEFLARLLTPAKRKVS